MKLNFKDIMTGKNKIMFLIVFWVFILSHTLSCKKDDINLPMITTIEISDITFNSAVSGGIITLDGGGYVTARGVCWSLTSPPTINDYITIDSSGEGTFKSFISGLNKNTTYFLRAYATNSTGTSYGNLISFKTIESVFDFDGNEYNIITIGTQDWLLENLRTTHYRNGDTIDYISDATLWSKTRKGAYCSYNNQAINNQQGYLYNWYAVNDSRKIAPVGWHVPTIDEWNILSKYLINNAYGYGGNGDDIGKSLANNSGWMICDVPGTVGNDQGTNNASGFTGMPAGIRMDNGDFYWKTIYTFWWSSTINYEDYVWHRQIDTWDSIMVNDYIHKTWGCSIRCLRD